MSNSALITPAFSKSRTLLNIKNSYLTDSPASLPPRVNEESRYLTEESILDRPKVPIELSRVLRKVAEVGVAFKLPSKYPLDRSKFILTLLTRSLALERVATSPVAIFKSFLEAVFEAEMKVGRRPKRHCSFSTWKSRAGNVANKEHESLLQNTRGRESFFKQTELMYFVIVPVTTRGHRSKTQLGLWFDRKPDSVTPVTSIHLLLSIIVFKAGWGKSLKVKESGSIRNESKETEEIGTGVKKRDLCISDFLFAGELSYIARKIEIKREKRNYRCGSKESETIKAGLEKRW